MENELRKQYKGYAKQLQTRQIPPRHVQNHASRNEEDNANSYVEKLISQGIVCAMMVAVVFSLSIIDTPYTQNLKQRLKVAISTEVSAEAFKNVVSLNFIDDAKNSVATIFNEGESAVELPAAVSVSEPPTEQIAEQTATQTNAQTVELEAAPVATEENYDFKIDEDILNGIDNKTDYYTENLKKQPPTQAAQN